MTHSPAESCRPKTKMGRHWQLSSKSHARQQFSRLFHTRIKSCGFAKIGNRLRAISELVLKLGAIVVCLCGVLRIEFNGKRQISKSLVISRYLSIGSCTQSVDRCDENSSRGRGSTFGSKPQSSRDPSNTY